MAGARVNIDDSSQISPESHSARSAGRRWSLIAGILTAVLLVGGVWGLAAPRGDSAGVGDAIGLDGGHATVVAVRQLDDPMMMMHESHDGFADAGMSMPNMIPDAVPDGMQRVVVEVLFEAGNRVMTFPAAGISLEADGASHRAYSALLADQQLRPGASLHGVLTFEIPSSITAGVLHISEDATPIVLTIDPSTHDHDHQGDHDDHGR